MTSAPRERLGIFGGTFDPVHVGHVVAAVEVRAALQLDQVLLVVAGDPWQKRGEVVASAADRLAVVRAAVEGVDGIAASDLEVQRTGATYTIDTVQELRSPSRELFLVVGADVAPRLDTWRDAGTLRQLVTLAIVTREGDVGDAPEGWTCCRITIPRLDVSSTDLRERLARGRPIDGLVPPGAVRIIRERRLYTPNR
ncbi:MAG: nicotinate-nucleotide adenylyltransferase [Acidimicrobiia bacterium]